MDYKKKTKNSSEQRLNSPSTAVIVHVLERMFWGDFDSQVIALMSGNIYDSSFDLDVVQY